MARTPRGEVFEPGKVGIYHCINRVVRRAFLCGNDPLSGQSFDHRKVWIRDRLEQLAGIFGIDVLSYSVMDNHLHVILRNRPDVVKGWSNEEIARRWWNLFPGRKNKHGTAAEPTQKELKTLQANKKRLRELRSRLSHISWYMRCLCEVIARRANVEDDCTGRFFQGRFKCQKLMDESAVLACCIYVDLNPIRAGVALTPETSEYTSAYDRIQAMRQHDHSRSQRGKATSETSEQVLARDGWLSLFPESESNQSKQPRRRASNNGFLPMSVEQYMELLDWTGRQVRDKKRGKIPIELAPILERLQIGQTTWLDVLENFGRRFPSAAGRAESMAKEASRRGRAWLRGIQTSRLVFGTK